MFRERVRHHFLRAGWTVEGGPDLEGFRPDLLVERRGGRSAVLVREEPPGPIALARFAHDCTRRGLRGIVVAPDDAVVAELCEGSGLQFLAGESMGEVPVVGVAPEPTLPLEPSPAPRMPVAPPAFRRAHAVPLWRWGVVALIWAAAIAVVLYDLTRL